MQNFSNLLTITGFSLALASCAHVNYNVVSTDTDLLRVQAKAPPPNREGYTIQSSDGCIIHIRRDRWRKEGVIEGGHPITIFVRDIAFDTVGSCPSYMGARQVIQRMRTGRIVSK